MILVRIFNRDRNKDHRMELPAVPRQGDTIILGIEEFTVHSVCWDLGTPMEIIVQVR